LSITSIYPTRLYSFTADQRKGFWHDILWWNSWDKTKNLDKRGATVTKYVTRTATVTVVKTKTPGTTVRMTDTVYKTKIKTRTISVNGKAVTTSDSEAVWESGGYSAQCSGSVLAGVVLAVVMVVYA